MSLFANLLEGLGRGLASFSTSACALLILDEPEMPKSLIEK